MRSDEWQVDSPTLCNLELHCTLIFSLPLSLSLSCHCREGGAGGDGKEERYLKKKKCLLCDCWGNLEILEFLETKKASFNGFFVPYSLQGFILFFFMFIFFAVFFSSHGPRSVKPMPLQTTTTTTSTTPMSLATRQPHSCGSNLCKQVIKKKQTLDLPHSLYYATHLYSTTSDSSSCDSSSVVLYTHERLRQPLIHIHLNAHRNATLPYQNTSSALQFDFFFLLYFFFF